MTAELTPLTGQAQPPAPLEIVAWTIDPSVRHQTILGTIDGLAPGQTLRLHANHEPKPLFYMIQAERTGQVDWSYEQEGPEEWIVRITRRPAEHTCC